MKKRAFSLLFFLIVLIGIVILGYKVGREHAYHGDNSSGVSSDKTEIKNTIHLSYEIDAKAAFYFDDTLFPEVYVNDSRGGKLSGTVLDLIKSVKGDPTLTSDSVGFLDYKYAINQWSKEGAARAEQVWAEAKREGRNYLTDEEAKSLIDSSGRIAPSRLPTSVHITVNITYKSISINGDVAKATFDDGSQTIEMTLVKVNERWYIAGEKIIHSHV